MNTKSYTLMEIFENKFPDGKKTQKLKRIEIPIIQRDYAQGRPSKEIKRVRDRFLDALYNAVTNEPITLDFVYGDITDGVLIPLDGQQRLTTLFLLHWYAAKKEQIPEEEQSFLSNFSYETRYSARDFCRDLVKFAPSFTEKHISAELKDQYWFPLEWDNDPTISSMLVMLDALEDKFKNVDNLWQRLQNRAITFYFLAIKDMGLTDELYIKMNSRGKPLTSFEHFKAEFERLISKVLEPEKADEIALKIDTDWTDMLWEYRNSGTGTPDDNVIDDEFLRYFRFVCDVICYQAGKSTRKRSSDDFDLLKEYFTEIDSENTHEQIINNIQLLEKFFDCWCKLPEGSPKRMQDKFFTSKHEPGKTIVDTDDVLKEFLHSKQYSLVNLIRLYAIVVFLLHRNDPEKGSGTGITDEQFARRIRIVYNLVKNSSNEISDSEDRVGGNRMPAILSQVDSIIIDGKIIDDEKFYNFNANQITEEIEKLNWTEQHPDQAETLFELEDHELLYGQISIVGVDHIDYASRFVSLFNCDRKLVDRALMSVGFYGQNSRRYTWRWQLGSTGNNDGWRDLFHKGANYGFEKTSEILIKLLSMSDNFSDEILRAIINYFLSDCETKRQFPWEYYYVKYDAFRPYCYGKYSISIGEPGPYILYVMKTKSYWSNSTYMPFLLEVDNAHISKEPNGGRLLYKKASIICKNDSFVIHWKDQEEQIETIEQENGIDKEDRIEKLRNLIQRSNLDE